MLDNRCGNAQQGLVAAEQALDKPACFLEVVAQVGIVGALVGTFDITRIQGIDL